MAKDKPVSYPNLMESMNAVVTSHAGIRQAIQEHAKQHEAALEHKRQSISITQDANRLMQS